MSKKMFFVLSTFVMLCLLTNCGLKSKAENLKGSLESQKAYSIKVSKNMNSDIYILGPNDIISIAVNGMPDYSEMNVRVRPDGKISLNLLGSIYVSGKTIEQLQDILYEKYKFYLKDPKFSIKLEKPKPFVVYISGAVANPGSYELDTDPINYQTINDNRPEVRIERKSPLISNIIVASGGVLYDSDIQHVVVKNSILGTETTVNLLDVVEKGDYSQDLYLTAGDSIYVPKLATPLSVDPEVYKKIVRSVLAPKSVPVKVFGYVNNPGLIRLDPVESLNLNSAIMAAGGYLLDSAYAPKIVYIKRFDENQRAVTIAINPMKTDLVLFPNDIIYVPEKPRPLVGKAFDYMNRVFTPANTFANSYNNWALMFKPTRYQVVGK